VEAPGIETVTANAHSHRRKRAAVTPPEPLAYSLARESQKGSAACPSTSPPAAPFDTDLAHLVERWPALSPTAKRMILAAVEADTPPPFEKL
jgi:hypothetical protein